MKSVALAVILFFSSLAFAQTTKKQAIGEVDVFGTEMTFNLNGGIAQLTAEGQPTLTCQMMSYLTDMTIGGCGSTEPEFGVMIIVTSEMKISKMRSIALEAGEESLTVAEYIEKQLAVKETAELGNMQVTRESCPVGSNAIVAFLKGQPEPGATQKVSCSTLSFQ